MSGKDRMLAGLRARIVTDLCLREWRDVWFFPRYEGVQGWRGTQRIMFVGLNPSTGRFASRHDRYFYAQLKRHGLAHAHLTDAIKERAVGNKVKTIRSDDPRMRRYQRYLLKEIEIIRPRLIVAMGRAAHEILTEKWKQKLKDVDVVYLQHYAWRFGKRRQFARRMAEIRRKYGENGRARLNALNSPA
jgi:uracil-DNA glycosylase